MCKQFFLNKYKPITLLSWGKWFSSAEASQLSLAEGHQLKVSSHIKTIMINASCNEQEVGQWVSGSVGQ